MGEENTNSAEITSEQADEILKLDLANVVAKVKSGKTLTTGERVILQGISGHTVEISPLSVLPFVKNQTELAKALDVTRKTIQRWRKEPDNPGAQSDGRYSVVAWRIYARSKGHVFGGEEGEEVNSFDKPKLQAEQIALKNEKMRHDMGVAKGRYIEKTVAKQAFGQLLLSAKTNFYSSIITIVTLSRIAPNTTEAAEAVRKEMDNVWKGLSDSKWLKE